MKRKGEEKLWAILNDKLDTLRAANRLPEAIRVAETALDIAKRAFKGNEASLATSFEKLGQLLEQKGDHTAALANLLKAQAILEKGKPPDQRGIYRSARRLAFLCDGLGQSEEALKFYQKAIAAGTQVEDVPYSEIGTMLNNVALILRKSGRQNAAEPCYLRALEIYEKQLGPDHADVASVLNNLAVYYTNQRRYTEAEKIHLRALAIRQKLQPPSLADIAQSQCNLAVVYHSRGEFAKAAEYYQSSLKIWEQLPEGPSKDYEVVVSNYADLLRSLGQARKAHQLEVRARKRRSG
jgi:tetratricopeptide (TPR) repeat protein